MYMASKAAKQPPSPPVLTWADVRAGGGGFVRSTLELVAQGAPFILRHTFKAADTRGEILPLFFYLEGAPPPGLLRARPALLGSPAPVHVGCQAEAIGAQLRGRAERRAY
eukprot:tig00001127_g7142.t1